MAKIYQKKVENNELFLDLWQGGNSVELRLLTESGAWYCTLATISDAGMKAKAAIDMNIAARAGIAIDANGRLKVIGQEVDAERMPRDLDYRCTQDGVSTAGVIPKSDGSVCLWAIERGNCNRAVLSITDLRDLHTRIGKHLAYLEQEGLA